MKTKVKTSIIVAAVLLAVVPTIIAAPIDFDNLHVVSTGFGVAGDEGRTRLMAAYNNKIYFIISEDGTAKPSKVNFYDPSDGWSNSVNHTTLAQTSGKFTTIRQIGGLLYFSDSLGNVYSFDGSTLAPLSGTPFTANNFVTSIVEFNSLIYFGTSTCSIYRYDGNAYEQVYEVSNRSPILDMAYWQKDGYLYVSVGPEKVCCPPTGYTIRSNSGAAGSWEKVFENVWHTPILMPTPEYLYTGVLDSAYWFGSSVRKSIDGNVFPVIHQSSGEYKFTWGSLYYDDIVYFFTNAWNGHGYRILDDNGTISVVPNQNWSLTQAVVLNGQAYALASTSHDVYQPAVFYLATTATLTLVSPNGGEEFVSGNTETITWQAFVGIENVSIEYSVDNGLTWTMIDPNTPNDGEYEWVIPEVTSDQCLVRLTDAASLNVVDVSDQTFTIFVCRAGYDLVGSIGGFGTGDGRFISPRDIAFDRSGCIYITDNDNNRIQKFTSNGQFITKWNCNDPMGIAVCPDGYVYVADNSGNRIRKFELTDGTYEPVSGWQISSNAPIGVGLDLAGNIYVCESGTGSVKKYSSDSSYLATLDGDFTMPTYLHVDSKGDVYVADYGADCIKKLTSGDGVNYVQQVVYTCDDPQSVAVDTSGYLYVSEYNDNLIKKFTPNGNLVTSWGQGGLHDGDFTNPIGIKVNSVDQVYIADHGAHRIQIFEKEVPLLGDVNSDCHCNLLDFAVLASQWLECGNPYDPKCR